MKLDQGRLVRAIALGSWALFFVYLWATREMTRYLGPRTYWVVIFGAIALGLAALAHFGSLRTPDPRPTNMRELLGMLLLIAPIFAVIVIPSAELGALAASRKSSGGLASAVANISPPNAGEGPASFIDIHYANQSREYAEVAGVVEGAQIELIGFVTDTTSGGFELTRFYVSCCAADAVPYSVRVISESSQGFEDDQWLRVTGTIEQEGSGYSVVADSISVIEAPDDPYLT